MNNNTQEIRESQFILIYGPGSIIESKNGSRLIPDLYYGLSNKEYSKNTLENNEFNDIRMSSVIRSIEKAQEDDIHLFSLPIYSTRNNYHSRVIYNTYIFPTWKICHKSDHDGLGSILFNSAKPGKNKMINRCPLCGKESDTNVRFLLACRNGHLDDINWNYAVHFGSNKKCYSDWFIWKPEGSSPSEIKIQCPTCKTEVSMLDIYGLKFECTGRLPEKQMPFNIKTRITELAAKNGTHNYMDDVFASDEKITVVNPKNGQEQKIQLEDAINKLEDYVEICKLIDELKITDADYTELTDNEKKNAKALYEEDGVNGLVELYKDNTANPIEKARTARQLAFIRDYYGGDWIEKNGLSVVTAILEKTIQTAAIENYGTFKPTEYGVVQIPSENEFPYFLVTIKDPVSGATDDVVFTPIAAGEYAQAILLLRNLRETDNSKLTDKERLQKIEHTIRVIKKCLGKEVEDMLGVTYTKQVK